MCQALFQEETKQIKIRCHLHYIKEKQYVIWVKYYGMKISVSREGWVIILSRVERKHLTEKKKLD